MRRTKRLAIGLAVAGLATAAAVAVAVPALAGAGPFGPAAGVSVGQDGNWSPGGPGGPGGPGPGYGPGFGGHGNGAGMGQDGTCNQLATVPSGTLTAEQQATLASMAEEEKLAGDLYRSFEQRYPDLAFDRIAAAEDRHLAAVRTMLERYGVADPTADRPAGEFATAEVQATYDRLLAEGLANQAAAIGVGRQVEEADIAALDQALAGLDAPDVERLYQQLQNASRQHLAAFEAWAAR